MSSSFIPKIAMSKGTAKDTKFDVSVNCHTTSEVGYLQPTFSKLLMPNSSLKIKSSDSVLMSSLVCPTFGDLTLRSWYMATPVSSLWAPLGAFLTGRAFNDRYSPSGSSIPQQMPKASQAEMIRSIIWAQYWKYAAFTLGNQDVSNMPCPAELRGNLTYLLKGDGYLATNELFDIDDLQNLVLKDPVNNSPYSRFLDYVINHGINGSRFLNAYPIVYNSNSSRYELSYTHGKNYADYQINRFSIVFPWWWNGFVFKNTARFRRMLTTSQGHCSFPDETVCPYVVGVVPELTKDFYKVDDYDSIQVGQTAGDGGIFYYPLTLRMFQGDTDFSLYDLGWQGDRVVANSKFYHPTGDSLGWTLSEGDAYYTGDIPEPKKFDCVSVQCNYSATTDPTAGTLEFFAGVRYSRRFKRIRKLFIGLGNQFNPFDTDPLTPWKIMAYYKGWFDNFYPKRDVQYYQTPLSRLVNEISYASVYYNDYWISSSITLNSNNLIRTFTNAVLDFAEMVFACGDAKYLMPIDYFTLADKNPLEYSNTSDENMDVVEAVLPPSGTDPHSSSNDVSGQLQGFDYFSSDSASLNGWAVKMADKMLKYLTKKRVVGKSVSDSMRAIFGAVDEHDKAHESTWCFGTHSTPIQISAVMSTAETAEMHLGDYAGRGLGGDTSKVFDVDVKSDLLVVCVMTAVVPRLGYYQGNLKENTIGSSPNDFCKPIWDAVGYDDVNVSEYIADAVHKVDLRNPNLVPSARGMESFNGKILGLVPRSTWYKTSRDILNGDMSIPSLKDSMNPYVLTRDVALGFSTDPLEMRTIAPDSFNKIFNESSSLDDHFIIQIGHKADMYAPLKSITTSFEDFDTDEDGTIEVEHS